MPLNFTNDADYISYRFITLSFYVSKCFNFSNLVFAVKLVVIKTIRSFSAKVKASSAHLNISVVCKRFANLVLKSSASPVRIKNFISFYAHIIPPLFISFMPFISFSSSPYVFIYANAYCSFLVFGISALCIPHRFFFVFFTA